MTTTDALRLLTLPFENCGSCDLCQLAPSSSLTLLQRLRSPRVVDPTHILGHVDARIKSAAQLITAAKAPLLVRLGGDLPRSEILLSRVWGQMCRCHRGYIMQAPLRSEIRQWHPVDADLLVMSSEQLPVTKADCNLFPLKCSPDLGEKNNPYLNKLEYLDIK